VETYHALREVLEAAGHQTNLGDEGGYSPDLPSNEHALKLLIEAIVKAGYEPGRDIYLAIDPAASEFYEDGVYVLEDGRRKMTGHEMIGYYEDLVARYPIVSIEDGLDQEDWEGWKKLTARLGGKVQLVGDDLFVTNKQRLAMGIEREVANSILVKVNQIGRPREGGRVQRRGLTPQRRDRRQPDQRPCRGDRGGADKSRGALLGRQDKQVQPTVADRGEPLRQRHLPRRGGIGRQEIESKVIEAR
jgi:hypothetical protein